MVCEPVGWTGTLSAMRGLTAPRLQRGFVVPRRRCGELASNQHNIALPLAFPALHPGTQSNVVAVITRYRDFVVHRRMRLPT
jgi:hypothetical protein